MAEWIGVTGPQYFAASLKRELLIFDRIAYPALAQSLRFFSETPWFESDGNFVNELTWLMEKGIVFDPFTGDDLVAVLPDSTEAFAAVSSCEKTTVAGATEDVISDAEIAQMENDALRLRKGEIPFLHAWAARAFAPVVRERLGTNAIAICDQAGLKLPEALRESRAEVVQVVISDLPVPGDRHSLEDVIAFRDEARSVGLTQGLRVWINEMASGKLTPVEVSDKLEDLVSRYERALKLEKMSRTTGVVETLLVTTAEVAESLVKFNWSTAAKKLFYARHMQIDLMKAEMTAPGREVGYIVKARERFGG